MGHVGVLWALRDAGWSPHRVAGASAGALAGATAVAGATPEQMREALERLDYRGFALADIVGRLSGRRVVGAVLERIQPEVVDPLTWIEELLADHGVRTFADLRLDDESVPPSRRYRLVVRCLDVVHRRVVRLPWDYHRFGLDPDEQSVARAVRASMAVPIVFDPIRIGSGADAGLLVDGGITSGFPVSLFDERGGVGGRPTIAVRLLPRPREAGWPEGDLGLVRAVVDTMLEAGDQLEPVDPCDERRTIRIDASAVASLDVRMTREEEQSLFEAGLGATEAFLADFDHEQWLEDCS
jgi:NTE family protein